MSSHQPGTLDPTFGQEGIAPIPPEPPRNPDVETLQVYPATMDGAGRIACYGYNLDDGENQLHPLFTRIQANGQWDDGTGHVAPPAMDSNESVLNVHYFETLISLEDAQTSSYLAVSRPFHLYDNGDIAQHVAVARLTETFQPWPGFGANGIAVPVPPEALGRARRNKKAYARLLRNRPRPSAIDYRGIPKIGYAGGALRVVFTAAYYGAAKAVETTYLALLDPNTGAAIPGLGDGGNAAICELLTPDGTPLSPWRVEFFDDGSFLCLGEANDKIHLMRYRANGQIDQHFGQEGQLIFESRGRGFGLAATEDGIWVSSTGPLSTVPYATLIYAYTPSGQVVDEFGNKGRVALQATEGNLQLPHLRIDAHGRLVLAGHRLYIEPGNPLIQTRLRLARLLPDGSLDGEFGEGGHFQETPYLLSANDLYVAEDEIRVLSLLPYGSIAFYEVIAKINA